MILASFWAHFDLLGLFQTKLMFLQKYFGQEALFVLGAKNQFLFEKVQKGANRPKMAPNDQRHVILTIWGSFGPHSDIGKTARFGRSWSQKGHYEPPVHIIGG